MSQLITKIEELLPKEKELIPYRYEFRVVGREHNELLSDIKQTIPQILSLIASEIEKKLPDERKTAEFGDYVAETYDEKMLVREVLLDIIKLLK